MDFNKALVNSGQTVRPQVSPQQNQQQPQQPSQSGGKLKKLLPIVAVVLVVLLIIGGVLAFNGSSASSYIDRSKYQAVFLTNGQVYFGKLSLVDDQYIKLNDIYYLQLNESLQAPAGDEKQEGDSGVAGAATEPQLVKLGQEIHGPDDEMILNRDQVLFWENLKQDGTLSKTIKDYVEKQKNNN